MTNSPACAPPWSSRAWCDVRAIPPKPGESPGIFLVRSEAMTHTHEKASTLTQSLVGAGVTAVGIALAAGAISIPSAAGYGGIGPNFMPWAIAAVLALCGILIIRE